MRRRLTWIEPATRGRRRRTRCRAPGCASGSGRRTRRPAGRRPGPPRCSRGDHRGARGGVVPWHPVRVAVVVDGLLLEQDRALPDHVDESVDQGLGQRGHTFGQRHDGPTCSVSPDVRWASRASPRLRDQAHARGEAGIRHADGGEGHPVPRARTSAGRALRGGDDPGRRRPRTVSGSRRPPCRPPSRGRRRAPRRCCARTGPRARCRSARGRSGARAPRRSPPAAGTPR